MGVLIRADDLPAAQRAEAWLSVVCDTLGPLDVHMDRDVPLWGQIEAARLGPLEVGRIHTATPHRIVRTPGLIRKGSQEHYRVVMPVSGSLLVEQDGRSARLNAGDLALYDFARPYELVYDSTVELAVFSFPREMLAVASEAVSGLTAVPISGSGGAAALAVPLLSRVAQDVDTYQPASAARLSSVVMDLLTTTVAERASRVAELAPETREQALLRRIHAFIEQHLADESLGPAAVAAAHHVSLRYLHRLFASQDTTLAAWIRRRRLERCRRDLADPVNFDQPVGAIAARWGLSDPAHFSRLFRQAYGVPPVEYRRASLMRAAG
ncbi:helix-turn-helix domain-containing protein [Bailinhaonella thermotolerans]|uniref:Helix-turn-helix domain-containing protein n=1 Tax=Bailinhaonella thermotolerans TaxID=1070861 RepID=A0A3A4AGP1_9ACTN|nr:helix-turn-helix domain-containing protein [Bailinhaonella thermotolerans]RJL19507.1 helix-turn-helix domain-containing protein [Bailinhaonella thermotolerans]